MRTISELEELIKVCRRQYWIDNDPQYSDLEYDSFIEELKLLDSNNELLTEIESDSISDTDKVQHETPMLSLDKVFSYEEILKWLNSNCRSIKEEYLISPKYDGISAKFYSMNNLLATRGNGYFGENITNKMPLLEFETNEPLHNKNVVGEVVIKHNNFNTCELVRKDGKRYKTPRNMAAGLMNLKDISNVLGKIQLTFIEHKKYTKSFTLEEFSHEFWNNIINGINTLKKTYPLDGIVIELKDENYSNSLGDTSHHPRGKIAFKFENNFATSTIISIDFQSGKRKLTPVANIDPVEIDGVLISRVSLHNAKTIIDNNIHIGDIINVVRSGDVIPYITAFKPGGNRKPIKISECPYCRSKLQYKEPELYCTNSNCIGTLSKQLFESIRTLGIEEVGQTTVDKFIDELGIETIIDFLSLEYSEIENLEGFGETSANKIIENINSVINSIEDYKVLASLNIKSIGTTLSKQILKYFTLEELLEVTEYDLITIPNMGGIRSIELANELQNNKNILIELMEILTIIETKNITNNSHGTICFSGSFPHKKDYYQKLAIGANYIIVESVTKDLTYLVTAGASTSKVTKARNYSIPILSVEDFLKLIGK